MEIQNPTIPSFFIRTTWFLFLFIMFRGVKSQDQSSAGLLCISECGTCPKVCSPPPAPEVASTPPPSSLPRPPPLPHSPPPVPPYSFLPPPGVIITPVKPQPVSPPVHNYPPSFPYYFLPPPSQSLPPPLSPPSRPATPPPPSNNFNIPASVAPPAGYGQRNPYYYFYVSEAASKTLCGPIIAALLICFCAHSEIL